MSSVPDDLPIFVGPGTIDGLATGRLGPNFGDPSEMSLGKLREYRTGNVNFLGLTGGYDVFGDGSFVVVPAPGVSERLSPFQIDIIRSPEHGKLPVPMMDFSLQADTFLRPQHCAGHSIAIARTSSNPDSCELSFPLPPPLCRISCLYNVHRPREET